MFIYGAQLRLMTELLAHVWCKKVKGDREIRGQDNVCHEHRPKVCGTVLKMGVWPPEVCLQGLASNRSVLLRSKGVVVSD